MGQGALSRASRARDNLKLAASPQAIAHLERVFGVGSQPVKEVKGTEKKYTKTKFGLALNRIKEVYSIDAAGAPEDAEMKLDARSLAPLMQYAVKPGARTSLFKGTMKWTVEVNGDDEPFTIEEENERGVTFLEAAAQYVKRERKNSLQDGGATSAP